MNSINLYIIDTCIIILSNMALCQSAIYPYIFYPLFVCIIYGLHKLYCKITQRKETLFQFTYGLCMILECISSCILLKQDFWLPTIDRVFELGTVDLPAIGWFYDYIISFLLSLYLIIDYIISIVRSPHFSINNINIPYKSIMLTICMFIIAPTSLIVYCIYNTTKFLKALDQTDQINKVSFIIIIIPFIILELYLWIPVIYDWDKNHCWLDGFMSTSNPISAYVTRSLLITYTLSIILYLTTIENKSRVKEIILLALFGTFAFTNNVIGMTSYYLYAIGMMLYR